MTFSYRHERHELCPVGVPRRKDKALGQGLAVWSWVLFMLFLYITWFLLVLGVGHGAGGRDCINTTL